MLRRLFVITVFSFSVAVGSAASSNAADAEKDGFPGSFSANVAFTSEYLFRGLSQTDDAPAVQGGFDYEFEIAKPAALYLGVWGSNVDFNEGAGVDGATVEIDYYGGVRGTIGDTGLGWDAGVIYYTYPGADSSLDYDFFEVQAGLSYDFKVATVGASINYSPKNFGDSGDAYYPKLSVDVPVGDKLTLSGYVAKQWIEKEDVFGQPDYLEWNLSATYNIVGFDLAVAYSDTDIDGNPDGAGKAVIFTVSRSF